MLRHQRIELSNPGVLCRLKETADPSTAFGAKYAPNFAQDDNVVIYAV
jgi:hypothetical protein